MYLLNQDLARAHCRSTLKDAEQNRRFRLAQQIERAQKQAAHQAGPTRRTGRAGLTA